VCLRVCAGGFGGGGRLRRQRQRIPRAQCDRARTPPSQFRFRGRPSGGSVAHLPSDENPLRPPFAIVAGGTEQAQSSVGGSATPRSAMRSRTCETCETHLGRYAGALAAYAYDQPNGGKREELGGLRTSTTIVVYKQLPRELSMYLLCLYFQSRKIFVEVLVIGYINR
jgi:hypothetical protein